MNRFPRTLCSHSCLPIPMIMVISIASHIVSLRFKYGKVENEIGFSWDTSNKTTLTKG